MGWISGHLLVLNEGSKKKCIQMKNNFVIQIWVYTIVLPCFIYLIKIKHKCLMVNPIFRLKEILKHIFTYGSRVSALINLNRNY